MRKYVWALMPFAVGWALFVLIPLLAPRTDAHRAWHTVILAYKCHLVGMVTSAVLLAVVGSHDLFAFVDRKLAEREIRRIGRR
ncbi:MAG: hypothetical protein HYY17_00580 [Planctomycetes bacterium]|nr:hypothetical protein [Planctomycetota bacterium]